MIKAIIPILMGIVILSSCKTHQPIPEEPITHIEVLVEKTMVVQRDPCLDPLQTAMQEYLDGKKEVQELYDLSHKCLDEWVYLSLRFGIEAKDPNVLEKILSW